MRNLNISFAIPPFCLCSSPAHPCLLSGGLWGLWSRDMEQGRGTSGWKVIPIMKGVFCGLHPNPTVQSIRARCTPSPASLLQASHFSSLVDWEWPCFPTAKPELCSFPKGFYWESPSVGAPYGRRQWGEACACAVWGPVAGHHRACAGHRSPGAGPPGRERTEGPSLLLRGDTARCRCCCRIRALLVSGNNVFSFLIQFLW